MNESPDVYCNGASGENEEENGSEIDVVCIGSEIRNSYSLQLKSVLLFSSRFGFILFQREGAEQGRGEWGEVQRRHPWDKGVLQQRDRFARSAIKVRCSRCVAPKPIISKDTDNDTNNDIKYPDNLNDGTEDANHNGRIDGDNGDGIYQPESEKWKETSPIKDDSDDDLITDNIEKSSGYNPCKADTDSDGINDGIEDADRNGEKDAGETDPTEMDTDGDGLSDLMEEEGWTVCIVFEATREVKEKYEVTSDPNDPDSDDDDLNDMDEYKNTTDPNKSDTDGDGKTDYQELNGDYNSSATGIDGEPPEIWHYDCKYKIKKTKLAFVKVPSGLEVWMEVGARDIFGLDNIEIFISGLEDKKVYTDKDQNVTVEFEWSLSGIDEYKRAFFDGFDINVTATDINNNIGFRNEELDSIKNIVVEAFVGTLLVVAKFITELVSGMFDWIYDSVTSIFDSVLKKINDVIDFILDYINEIMERLIRTNSEEYVESIISEFFEIFDHPLLFVIFAIDIAILAVCFALNTIPIVAIVSAVLGLVIVMLLMIFNSDEGEESNGIEDILKSKMNLLFEAGEDEGTKAKEPSWWVANFLKYGSLVVSLSSLFISMLFSKFSLISVSCILLSIVVWFLSAMIEVFSINLYSDDAWYPRYLFQSYLFIFSSILFIVGTAKFAVDLIRKEVKYATVMTGLILANAGLLLLHAGYLIFCPAKNRYRNPSLVYNEVYEKEVGPTFSRDQIDNEYISYTTIQFIGYEYLTVHDEDDDIDTFPDPIDRWTKYPDIVINPIVIGDRNDRENAIIDEHIYYLGSNVKDNEYHDADSQYLFQFYSKERYVPITISVYDHDCSDIEDEDDFRNDPIDISKEEGHCLYLIYDSYTGNLYYDNLYLGEYDYAHDVWVTDQDEHGYFQFSGVDDDEYDFHCKIKFSIESSRIWN